MAKTKKTARELAAMVMREVRASGKCSDLQSVVVHPTGRNYPTWECATQVNKHATPPFSRLGVASSCVARYCVESLTSFDAVRGTVNRPQKVAALPTPAASVRPLCKSARRRPPPQSSAMRQAGNRQTHSYGSLYRSAPRAARGRQRRRCLCR